LAFRQINKKVLKFGFESNPLCLAIDVTKVKTYPHVVIFMFSQDIDVLNGIAWDSSTQRIFGTLDYFPCFFFLSTW
jgi:glutamine cyclotransferase